MAQKGVFFTVFTQKGVYFLTLGPLNYGVVFRGAYAYSRKMTPRLF